MLLFTQISVVCRNFLFHSKRDASASLSFYVQRNKRIRSSGFTLIEVLIVLGIIAGLMASAVSMIGVTAGSQMRKEAGNLNRIIRYVYHQAALTNQYYRLTFNLDDQQYFVEYSDTPFYVVKEGDKLEEIRLDNEEGLDEDDLTAGTAAATGNFAESEDDLLEVYKLSSNIKIAGVQIAHQNEKATAGVEYLYFFPRGYTEFAVIHISDQDEESYMTLIVNPLTGVVDMEEEFIEYEDALTKIGAS